MAFVALMEFTVSVSIDVAEGAQQLSVGEDVGVVFLARLEGC